MVTVRELQRRIDRLEGADGQIFIFRPQEDGSVLVTKPGRPDAGEQCFADYESACQALGLPSGPPDVVIQRSWLA
jgi:hypothetical protein